LFLNGKVQHGPEHRCDGRRNQMIQVINHYRNYIGSSRRELNSAKPP
jgi:hypothetical protein